MDNSRIEEQNKLNEDQISKVENKVKNIETTLTDHETVFTQIWQDINQIQNLSKSGTVSFLNDLKKVYEDLDKIRKNILASELKASNFSAELEYIKLETEKNVLNSTDENGKAKYSNAEKRTNAVKELLKNNSDYQEKNKKLEELNYTIKTKNIEEKRLKDSAKWLTLSIQTLSNDKNE